MTLDEDQVLIKKTLRGDRRAFEELMRKYEKKIFSFVVRMVRNEDTPGIVGRVGTILGAQGVNIARMGLGRKPGSGRAIMLIEVDSEVPPALLADLAKAPGIREARFLRLG